MSTLEMTFEELKSLPPAQLAEAAGYIHRLKLASVEPRREALERSFGCLTAAEAEDLERAIAVNCERIDGGEESTITKHDRPVARLLAAERPSREQVARLFHQMDALRQTLPRSKDKTSLKDLINQGRRFCTE
jgi:antitoxin (DNA-binding transcriptional repressor) of toxin-antitoxin stability system